MRIAPALHYLQRTQPRSFDFWVKILIKADLAVDVPDDDLLSAVWLPGPRLLDVHRGGLPTLQVHSNNNIGYPALTSLLKNSFAKIVMVWT